MQSIAFCQHLIKETKNASALHKTTRHQQRFKIISISHILLILQIVSKCMHSFLHSLYCAVSFWLQEARLLMCAETSNPILCSTSTKRYCSNAFLIILGGLRISLCLALLGLGGKPVVQEIRVSTTERKIVFLSIFILCNASPGVSKRNTLE